MPIMNGLATSIRKHTFWKAPHAGTAAGVNSGSGNISRDRSETARRYMNATAAVNILLRRSGNNRGSELMNGYSRQRIMRLRRLRSFFSEVKDIRMAYNRQ